MCPRSDFAFWIWLVPFIFLSLIHFSEGESSATRSLRWKRRAATSSLWSLDLFEPYARTVIYTKLKPQSSSEIVIPTLSKNTEAVSRRRRSSSEAQREPQVSSEMRRHVRVLRKKKRRLKELRREIRLITAAERNQTLLGTRSGEKATRSGEKGTRSGRDSIIRQEKWRRKVLAKMHLIVDRLERLEKAAQRGSLSAPPAVLHIPPTAPLIITTDTPIVNASRRINKKYLDVVIAARNGENGTACVTHKDCRPGRCCHLSATAPAGICVFHGMTVNSPCRDSCQCEQQLNCFLQNNKNFKEASCKRASSKDIMEGVYIYNLSSYFSEDLPPIQFVQAHQAVPSQSPPLSPQQLRRRPRVPGKPLSV